MIANLAFAARHQDGDAVAIDIGMALDAESQGHGTGILTARLR
jgi:hypothetical protein